MRKFNVNVDGRSYLVEVEEIMGDSVSAPRPMPVAAQPVAAPQVAVKAAPAKVASKDGVALNAPMPGTVIDFKVANGATVKKGDIVLILEAMKMETNIVANSDGVISFVVAKSATVNSNEPLAYIK